MSTMGRSDGLGILIFRADVRIPIDVVTAFPSPLLPIGIREVIGDKHVDVSLHDACRFQAIQTASHQSVSDAAASMRGFDDDVLEITTPAIVTAHPTTDR